MFNINTRKSAIFLALMVLLSAGTAGVVMAAAPTIDTETSNTSPQSDIVDAGTQTHNDTTSSSLGWSADTPNSSVEIAHDGDTLFEASPENYSAVDSGTDGTLDLWYFNVSLADDGSDYDGLEVGAGEQVTLNVTITNDTEANDPDTTNISYTFNNTESQALIASENPESEEDDDGFFSGFSTSSLNVFSSESDDEEDVGTVLSTDSTTVTENTETVELDTLDSNLTDAYSASTSDANEGALIWDSYTQLSVDDEPQYVPVFYQSADDDVEWLNTSEDAYATISSDGQTMTVHNPDALLDDDQSSATMDVTTVGDEKLGMGNSAAMFSNYDAGFTRSNIGAFAAADPLRNPDFVNDEREG